MFFNITNRSDDGATTLALVGEQVQTTVPSTHPQFARLVEYLTNTPADEVDETFVQRLVNPAESISEVLSVITDRLVYRHNNLFFDGVALNNALGRQILARLENGDDDWERFVRFLINLDANPSYRAQQALFTWIDRNGLTITPEGNLIGYKGVNNDGTSSHSGPNNYIDGVLLGEPGRDYHVPHEIGTVVSKRRADVDDNPGLACSTGLHVGTKEYAESFAPRLLTVEFSPADVVSIPDSDLDYKIRVCSYKVVALAEPSHFASTSVDFDTDEEQDTTCRCEAERGSEGGHYADCSQAVDDGGYVPFTPAEEAYFDALEDGADEATTNVEDFDTEGLAGEEPAAGEVAGPDPDYTLAENAALEPALKADLEDTHLGHKPLARKWSHLTTEASVRRYRKSNGIVLTLATKVKDAVS